MENKTDKKPEKKAENILQVSRYPLCFISVCFSVSLCLSLLFLFFSRFVCHYAVVVVVALLQRRVVLKGICYAAAAASADTGGVYAMRSRKR